MNRQFIVRLKGWSWPKKLGGAIALLVSAVVAAATFNESCRNLMKELLNLTDSPNINCTFRRQQFDYRFNEHISETLDIHNNSDDKVDLRIERISLTILDSKVADLTPGRRPEYLVDSGGHVEYHLEYSVSDMAPQPGSYRLVVEIYGRAGTPFRKFRSFRQIDVVKADLKIWHEHPFYDNMKVDGLTSVSDSMASYFLVGGEVSVARDAENGLSCRAQTKNGLEGIFEGVYASIMRNDTIKPIAGGVEWTTVKVPDFHTSSVNLLLRVGERTDSSAVKSGIEVTCEPL